MRVRGAYGCRLTARSSLLKLLTYVPISSRIASRARVPVRISPVIVSSQVGTVLSSPLATA